MSGHLRKSCAEWFVESHNTNDTSPRIKGADIKHLTIPAPVGSHDLRSKLAVRCKLLLSGWTGFK